MARIFRGAKLVTLAVVVALAAAVAVVSALLQEDANSTGDARGEASRSGRSAREANQHRAPDVPSVASKSDAATELPPKDVGRSPGAIGEEDSSEPEGASDTKPAQEVEKVDGHAVDKPDRSSEYSPEAVAAIVARLDAIEDLLKQHVPTGTSSEAFYSSLGDDGSVWDMFCRVGELLRAEIDATNNSGRGLSSGDSAPILELTTYRDSSLRVYLHEARQSKAKEAMLAMEPEFTEYRAIALPRRIFMIRGIGERSRTVSGSFDSAIVPVVTMLNGLIVTTIAHCIHSSPEVAHASVDRLCRICFSLVPTRMLEAMIAVMYRGKAAELLLAVADSGLLPPHKIAGTLAELSKLPLSLEYAPAGEALQMLSSFPGYSNRSSAVLDMAKQMAGNRWSMSLSESLAQLESFVAAIDRSTPFGKLCAPHPLEVTPTEALAAAKHAPLLEGVLLSMGNEVANLQLAARVLAAPGSGLDDEAVLALPFSSLARPAAQDSRASEVASSLWQIAMLGFAPSLVQRGSVGAEEPPTGQARAEELALHFVVTSKQCVFRDILYPPSDAEIIIPAGAYRRLHGREWRPLFAKEWQENDALADASLDPKTPIVARIPASFDGKIALGSASQFPAVTR